AVLHPSVLLLFNSFSLHSYAAHRNLHSFPTRRSSDLKNIPKSILKESYKTQQSYKRSQPDPTSASTNPPHLISERLIQSLPASCREDRLFVNDTGLVRLTRLYFRERQWCLDNERTQENQPLPANLSISPSSRYPYPSKTNHI